MENLKFRIILQTLRIVLTLCAVAAGCYVLYRYEYFEAFGSIDNVAGAAPVALITVAVGGFSALLWTPHKRRLVLPAVALSVAVALSAALFPNALRGNWWLSSSENLTETMPDISVYRPFNADSKTAKLSEPSALTLVEDLPVMDGALALYPLYAAFADAVYSPSEYASECVAFTNTVQAFNALIAGERDVIFTAAASENQLKQAQNAGVELNFTPIGREAFVFLVGADNPVDGISYRQIRNIYSGKTSKWRTLGWAEGGDIIAFQRPDGSGSQTGLQQIMKGLPIAAPRPLPDSSLIGTNSLMQQISVEWKGVQPALGYSYKYFATVMYPNPRAKLLKVDGVEPSAENISNGSYPFTVEFYAVTRGEPQGNVKALIDWILSPQGQYLVELTGYAPISRRA